MILFIFCLFVSLTQYCKTETHIVPHTVTIKQQQAVIKIAAVEMTPFMHVKNDVNGSAEFEGLIPDLIEQIFSTPHNNATFLYEFYLAPDRKFGHKLENGTWTGMIGEVVSKIAYLAAGPLTISEERLDVVKFSFPFMTSNVVAIIKRPYDNKNATELPFRDFKEMTEAAGKGKLRFLVQKGGSTESMLKNSRDDRYRGIYDQMVRVEEQGEKSFMSNYVEGIEKVRSGSGRYVFLGEESTLSSIAMRKPCDLVLWDREPLNKAFYGLAFFTDVPDGVLNSINRKIIELQRSGAMKLLKEKWWAKKNECGSKTPKLCVCNTDKNKDVHHRHHHKNSTNSGESDESK